MGLCFKVLVYFVIVTGLHSADQISWLLCNFVDEEVSLNSTGHYNNTKHISREAVLQFGLRGDAPMKPDAVTFLITPSKVNLRNFLEGVDIAQLNCELHRHSTNGSHVRWPVKGLYEYNRWFRFTIRHSEDRFTIISFIRQSTDQPLTRQHEYLNWTIIKDKEILTTSVVMVMMTQTPKVTASLGSQQKLDCQFVIDHKGAKVAVEWHRLGEMTRLFNYSSQSGKSQGSGVNLQRLSAGDASYTIPSTNISSRGTYMCSVTLNPLHWSLPIRLNIEKAPQVSLNIGPTLTLSEAEEKKVVCEAGSYYSTDVDIEWSRQDTADVGWRVGAPLPTVLKNVTTLYSHKTNPDGTITLLAFFYLKAKLSDSGTQFTCTVSHQSLRTPIKKTFTLTVQEPSQWKFIAVGVFVLLVAILLLMRRLKKTLPVVQWTLCVCTKKKNIY